MSKSKDSAEKQKLNKLLRLRESEKDPLESGKEELL